DIQKYGTLLIFIGAMTPFPFDLIGIAAGLVRFDPKKLFLGAFCGKTIRYFVILLASNFGSPFILKLFGL
ncbi:MAG: VTT domain-containing protein, partial [archaeon]